MAWATLPESREQLCLFAEKLDDAISTDHPVRTLNQILERIDWSPWESRYRLVRGRPPIHPKVLAGVVLYGLMRRIRTSRGLEEALQVRLDFRWLAQGLSIDHSTISEFRQSNSDALCDLFVQIGLIARELGYLTLVRLGYDGTRIRANNRRHGSRTPEELRKAKKQLAEEFEAHRQASQQAQEQEDEAFAAAAKADADRQEKESRRQSERIDEALAELERIEASGKKIPSHLPTTDPHSRIAKNKEGGFAPNYNPAIAVDVDSGFIVDSEVISGTDEQTHMIDAVERARSHFQREEAEGPTEVLADGLMATGENIAACPQHNIEFYSPPGPKNPAYRDDPSQPVPEEKIAELPLRGSKPKKGKEDTRTFDKSAFVYDSKKDIYWCPMGQQLDRYYETRDHRGDPRYGYRASKEACAACPLKERCFKNTRSQYGRRIECGEHEIAKQAHAEKMRQPEAAEKYKRRTAATERPFAVIKHFLGIRQFLTRGLQNVRNEWRWATVACNLHRLVHLLAIRSGVP